MYFYDWNIGDYAKKTQHLTNDEDLAYRRLLDMYYDTESKITHCLATLSRRLRIDEKSIKNVMDEFFPDGINKHADEKISEYHIYLARQALNGSKGGRPKHKPSANPVLTQNNPVPSQPLTTNQEPLTTNQAIKPLSEYSDDFEEFWKAYPKKTGKGGAYTSWKKLHPPAKQVLKSLEWQINSDQWKKENGQFIPNPATYLNQRRWEDGGAVEYNQDDFMKRIGAK